MTAGGGAGLRLHSSTVAFPNGPDWSALVILGKSGAGKSELALALMAMGARLVADDQTEFHRDGPALWARAPALLQGLVEMRGIGLLHADAVTGPVRAFVNLDQTERDRMPPARRFTVLGVSLPMFYRVDSLAFPAALRQYMIMAKPNSEIPGLAGQDD